MKRADDGQQLESSGTAAHAAEAHGRGPRSGGNESVVLLLSDGAGGQATSSLCAPLEILASIPSAWTRSTLRVETPWT